MQSLFGPKHIVVQFKGSCTVPIPTVGVAIRVADALNGDSHQHERLAHATQEWLPLRLWSHLFARKTPDLIALHVVCAALWAGVPEKYTPGTQSADSGDVDGRTYDTRSLWNARISDYRSAYGLSLEDVLSEPWPVFLHQEASLTGTKARESIQWIRGYVAARTAGESLDRIYDDAEIESAENESDSETDVTPWKRKRISKSEYLDRKLARAHQVKNQW